MKKHLLVALLAAAVAMPASAQNIFYNPDNHGYLGARVALDVSAPASQRGFRINDLFSNSPGVSFGLVYNKPVFLNLYIEPGLSLYYNTISQNPDDEFYNSVTGQIEKLNGGSLRQWGLRLPIMVGYRFDILSSLSAHVFTGPQFSYNFSGRWNKKLQGSSSVTSNMYSGDYDLFHRFDAQWAIGVGVSISNYYVSVSGSIGLNDMMKNPKAAYEDIKYKMRKNGFSLTLGYNF